MKRTRKDDPIPIFFYARLLSRDREAFRLVYNFVEIVVSFFFFFSTRINNVVILDTLLRQAFPRTEQFLPHAGSRRCFRRGVDVLDAELNKRSMLTKTSASRQLQRYFTLENPKPV